MDIVTYALLKKQLIGIESVLEDLNLAYSYKGSVATIDDLPDDAELGDLYTVGTAQYVWDGTSWIMIAGAITNSEIDTLFE